MKSGITVVTQYNQELIKQHVETDCWGEISKLSERIIMLQDAGVRKALIELGWTPPTTKEKHENI